MLGLLYRDGDGVAEDADKAVYWYEKAAEQGHAEAQWALGFMYDDGSDVKQDYTKANYWYEKAADRGNSSAQNHLGMRYYEGSHGLSQDKQRGCTLLKAASFPIAREKYNQLCE